MSKTSWYDCDAKASPLLPAVDDSGVGRGQADLGDRELRSFRRNDPMRPPRMDDHSLCILQEWGPGRKEERISGAGQACSPRVGQRQTGLAVGEREIFFEAFVIAFGRGRLDQQVVKDEIVHHHDCARPSQTIEKPPVVGVIP